jgi:4'-phosphopantetheinyl transferase
MNISRKFAGTRGRKFLPLHATPPNTGEPKIRKKHMKKSNPYSSWTSTPDVQALTPNSVQIWRVPVQMTEDTRQVLESSLAPDERERAGRFHLPADRNRFLAAHGSLRDILARTLDCEAHQLEFSKGEHGKPCLVPEQGLEFNLAHSGDFSLIALARGRRVGIDVERVRSGISSNVISRQYFSKAEVADLESLPLEQRETAFFTCWTRKEAYIKARGLGLSLPLESFDVSLLPPEPASLRATRPEAQEAGRWKLLSLEVGPGYGAAAAVEVMSPEEQLEIRLRDWKFRS